MIARTLSSPLPGVVAGFIRTQIGVQEKWDWKDDAMKAMAMEIEVSGPLFTRNGVICLHAPADAVICTPELEVGTGSPEIQVMALRPHKEVWGDEGAGCNLPGSGLIPLEVTNDVKPESGYRLWNWPDIEQWLLNPTGQGFKVPEKIEGLQREERVHVQIDPETGGSAEGKLFSTEMLCS